MIDQESPPPHRNLVDDENHLKPFLNYLSDSNQSATILVVEGCAPTPSLLAELLTEGGYEVALVHSAREGIEHLSARRPDLVVIEKRLSDADGLELLRHLRSLSELRQVPAIMVSEGASDHDLAAALDLGAQDYLARPFSPRVFLTRVGAILRARQLQERIIESKRRYQLAITAARCGLWDWNIREDRLYLTRPLQDLLNLNGPLPTTMDDFLRLVDEEDREEIRLRIFEYARRGEGELDCEFRIPDRSAGTRWYLCRGRICRNTSFEPVRLLGALAEISERRRAELALAGSLRDLASTRDELAQQSRQLAAQNEALRQAARIDAMTGLLNRSGFHEMLEAEWSRARRYYRPLSCVMIDIDFFKRVNDSHGHIVGDRAIARVGELIYQSTRDTDHVCRRGGEEFCTLLTETNLHGAAEWAERVRRGIAETVFDGSRSPLGLTISLGVAEMSVWHHSPDEFLDAADQALLLAKRTGRNRVVVSNRQGGDSADGTTRGDRLMVLQGVVVADVMEPLTRFVRDSESILAASLLLRETGQASLPVVGEDGRLVGVVSEKDIVVVPIHPTSWIRPVREIMTDKVISYEAHSPAMDVLRFLQRVPIRGVVVVQDGKPVGGVTRSTILDWIHRHAVSIWGEIGENSHAGLHSEDEAPAMWVDAAKPT